MHFLMVEHESGSYAPAHAKEFFSGCPEGHDWSVLAETCRSKNISVFTVACRNNVFTQKAFSSIAASSGGQCTKIEVLSFCLVSTLI